VLLKRALDRIKLWWRVKRWKPRHHSDCISFLGPCNLCRERLIYIGKDPDAVKPLYELFTFRDGKKVPYVHGS
jgi:hypothetical protein